MAIAAMFLHNGLLRGRQKARSSSLQVNMHGGTSSQDTMLLATWTSAKN